MTERERDFSMLPIQLDEFGSTNETIDSLRIAAGHKPDEARRILKEPEDAPDSTNRLLSQDATSPISSPTGPLTQDRIKPFMYVAAFLGCLSSILLGYDIGIISGAILFIKDDMELSDTQVEFVLGSFNIFAVLGSICAGKISDAQGRKRSIAYAALVFLAGALLMAVSAGFWSLLLGRLVTGIGAGAGLVLSPLYTAEISPSRFRGRLVTLAEFFINLGIVLGYLCSYLLENLSPTVGWRVMLGLGGVPAICMLFGLLVMPESPRWLVQKGRHEEAEYSLGLTHWPDEAQDSLEKISKSVRIAERTHKHTWRALITSRVFVIGMGLGLSQQISGIEVSVYYTPQLLEDAGISSRDLILLASLCLGAIKLVSIVAAGRYID
eukprot:960193_1